MTNEMWKLPEYDKLAIIDVDAAMPTGDRAASPKKEKSDKSDKARKQSQCRKCRAHGSRVPLKGHCRQCPYYFCVCELCRMGISMRQEDTQLSSRKSTSSSTLEVVDVDGDERLSSAHTSSSSSTPVSVFTDGGEQRRNHPNTPESGDSHMQDGPSSYPSAQLLDTSNEEMRSSSCDSALLCGTRLTPTLLLAADSDVSHPQFQLFLETVKKLEHYMLDRQ